jgi:hypothetical protein
MNKITTNKIVAILKEKILLFYIFKYFFFLNFHKDLSKVGSDEKLYVPTRNSLVVNECNAFILSAIQMRLVFERVFEFLFSK